MRALSTKTRYGGKDTEYSVYIYHRPSNENNKHAQWERTSVTSDLEEAKKHAKTLFKSNKYEKVELQGTMASDSQERIARILKIYDEKSSVKSYLKYLSDFLPELTISLMVLAGIYFAI